MSDFKTPNSSTGFLLWKVTNFWQREIRKSLEEYDLTHTQFIILANIFYLQKRDQYVTQADIANQIGIDKMLTSNVIKALLRKDLISRTEHKTDTRAKVIKLTDNGVKILKAAVKSVEAFDKLFFSTLECQDDFNTELISLLD